MTHVANGPMPRQPVWWRRRLRVATFVVVVLAIAWLTKMLIGVVLLGAVVIGMIVGYMGPARGIADHIRAANLPFVGQVNVYGPNPFTGDTTLTIYLSNETTDADIWHLWCDVMLPAGAIQMGRDLHVYKGWEGMETPAFAYGNHPTCNAVPASIG